MLYKQIYGFKDFAELSAAEKWLKVFNKIGNNVSNFCLIILFLLWNTATSRFTERVFFWHMNSKNRDERNKAFRL